MPEFEIHKMPNSTVAYLYATRDDIDMSPDYQRQGAIWSIAQQQLLIDSLINSFDVPKIYLHRFPATRTLEDGRKVRYALVDGKQRLEAIFGFLDGEFALSDQFELVKDTTVGAKSLTYVELQSEQPMLVTLLNSTYLDVVVITTDDLELIEEMFSRLNESVPLNAAEKRNAFGGPCPSAVRELQRHAFFEKKLPFGNSRYRQYDLAAKCLYWEDQLHVAQIENRSPVRDVKKYRLDTFFRQMKDLGGEGESRVASDKTAAKKILDVLAGTFVDFDKKMLTSIGMISVYYLLAQKRASEGRAFPSRGDLLKFEEGRKQRRPSDEDDLERGEYEILEFNRLSQSPNDGGALTYRLQVLDVYCSALERDEDPLQALRKEFAALDE
jgi:hypothetical protein